jgi:pSer/pThr/pTyr-binding forkhead associated (FHA) protein
MPKLQIILPDGADISQELTEDVVTIGRVADNTIEIDDASVSSHHAQLSVQGNDYILKDLGSTNGTRLNGKNIAPEEEHRLQDGDHIRFGSIEASYVSETVAQPRAMPEEVEPAAVAAESSVRPANFENASPFLTKQKKKDPVALALTLFAIFAMLVFAGAVMTILGITAPNG